jgi:hyperosmotically inducible periplasmic protein
MKSKFLLLLTLSSACLPWQSLTAVQETTPRLDDVQAALTADQDATRSIRSARASELMGTEVHNASGTSIARIEDLLLDIENGRVVHVVLSGDGVGEGRVAVPARTFDYARTNRAVSWRGEPERLKNAPRLKAQGSNRPEQAAHAAKVYRHYGEQPYFTVEETTQRKSPNSVHAHGQPAGTTAPVKIGRVVPASDLIGADINGANDEKIAAVKDLIIDLRAGRVIAIIIGGGGFLGIGDAQNAIPPTAVSLASPDAVALRITASREVLRKAPRYKAGDATRFDDPGYTDEIYRSFEQESYTRTLDAGTTRANRRDRDDATLTPLDQGNSKDDVETTARIRKAILAAEDFSVNAQNVKIITRDGRITLRGAVNSAAEKAVIGEIAARESGASSLVDNQLDITGK